MTLGCSTGHCAAPVDLAHRTIAVGNHSGVEVKQPSLFYIDEPGAWVSLWKQHQSIRQPQQPIRTVDFESHAVVMVVLGPSGGGTSVEINGVRLEESRLLVSASRLIPAVGCKVIAVVTRPYHIVEIHRETGSPRSELAITDRRIACE
jgi:hypothetical protein